MAKPNQQQGIDYFPYDTDQDQDDKLQMIIGEFGIKGEVVFTKILAWTYKVNGYYSDWTFEGQLKFSKRFAYVGVSANLLTEIVARCIKWGLFDKTLLDTFKILSSVRIQNTWIEATKRRKNRVFDERYNLLGENVYTMYTLQRKMLASETQKEKEKEKESKEKVGIWDASDLEKFNESDIKKVVKLIEWLKATAPRILELPELFTPHQALEIVNLNNKNLAVNVLLSMHNWKDLLKKNHSAYLTFNNWYKRELKREGEVGADGKIKPPVLNDANFNFQGQK